MGASPNSSPQTTATANDTSITREVDGDLADSREAGRIGADQGLEDRTREQDAERAAGKGEDQALGHGLAKEPAAAGSERHQDREFTMTCLRAREQQIRHVGAGDEQHESDGDLQHPDRPADAAEDLVRERRHLQDVAVPTLRQRKKDVACVVGARRDAGTRRPSLDERIQLGLRGCHRDAFLQPSDQIEVMVVARPALVIREAERQPDLRVAVHEIRATRHDADDLKPSSIDVDAAADRSAARPKPTATTRTRSRHGWRAGEAGFVCLVKRRP